MQVYEIHIFKGDIIITCRLVVMDMFLIQMTTIFSLPVMEGQEKWNFPFITLDVEKKGKTWKHDKWLIPVDKWTRC